MKTILLALLISTSAFAGPKYCDLKGKCLICSKCLKYYDNCLKDTVRSSLGKYLKQEQDKCKFVFDLCKQVNKCDEPEEEK